MDTQVDANNKNDDHSLRLPKMLVLNFVVPLAVSILAALIIECWTGFFAQASRASSSALVSPSSILLVLLAIAISALFAKDTLRIWFRQSRYLREDYAVAGLLTFAFLTIAFLTIILTGIMPWNIGAAFTHILTREQISSPEAQFADYGFLIMLYSAAVVLISQGHRYWGGKKSLRQYKLEQDSEAVSIIKEGLRELYRIVKHAPPPRPYRGAGRIQYITQLEPVTDSLAWRDQARELLRLSSSTYAFDPVEDWHDRSACWLGSNVNTGNMVGIYPAHPCVDSAAIHGFASYAKRIARERHRRIDELVVAVKGNSAPELSGWTQKDIRVETEADLLDSLVNFTDYRNEIRRRVLVSHLPYSDLTLKDVYTPSGFFLATDAEEPFDNVEQYLFQWLEEPGQRQLALLGEYGQGKSTAALMFTYHLLFGEGCTSSRIPILIELRGRSPRNQTPLGLLGDWASQYRIEPQALMRLLIAGKLVLILEGFDEMALVGDAEMRLRHFKTLWRFCYPQAKILITGRPNFFFDEEELKAALGISESVGDQPYCEALRLAPFDIPRMQEALREHEESTKSQICQLAQHNERFKDLVARPSILHIVSVLWEKERLVDQVEDLNSAYVMGLFIRHSYRRQGLKEADAPGFMALTTSEREYFMRGIASYMASKHLPNQINTSQLNEAIEALAEQIPDSVSTMSSAISGEISQPLRLRTAEMQYGLEHVKTDVRACGLLVDDPAAPGTFRFGHKSFMEYLFAAVLAEVINEENAASDRVIMRTTNAVIDDILMLPVSVGFLSELIQAGIRSQSDKSGIDEDAERLKAERIFATRLLKAVSGGGRLSSIAQRLVLFDVVFKRSVVAYLPGSLRPIAALLSPASILLLACLLVIGFVFKWAGVFSPANAEVSGHLSLSRLLVALIVVALAEAGLLFFIRPYLRRMNRRSRARALASRGEAVVAGILELWNDICKKVNIHDEALHQVAGTWLLPWAKDEPFDYFLHSPPSDGANEAQNG